MKIYNFLRNSTERETNKPTNKLRQKHNLLSSDNKFLTAKKKTKIATHVSQKYIDCLQRTRPLHSEINKMNKKQKCKNL